MASHSTSSAGTILLLGLTTLTLPALRAQEFRGAITGTVTDPQGAAVPGAAVAARNVDTNTTQNTVTNDSGADVFPYVAVGHYSVSVTAAGFRHEVRNDIEVRVGDRLAIDFTLQIGAATEQVRVNAATPLLGTSDAQEGQVIDSHTLNDLPLFGRNSVMLTRLSTGVLWANPQPSTSERPWDNNGMENFNVNGSQGLTNNFLLDGIPNVSVENTKPANLTLAVSADATSEFKVQTNTYDAEYGRTGGGTVNISLKSGTNQYHGALYDYERNTVLNANLFQSNAARISRAPYHWTQPGVELDGPVRIPGLYDGRDKTFFMLNLEWIRLNQPGTNVDTVPTAAERQGDFSGLVQANGNPITIYDPLSTQLANGQNLRTAFPGNLIPAGRLNPTGLAIAGLIPLPNAPGTATGLQNFIEPTYNLRVPNSRNQSAFDSAICMVSRECSILRSIHWSTRRLNRLWVAIRRRSSFTHSWRTYSVRLFI